MSKLREPTFAEIEGTKSLPSQMKLREISQEVRAGIWGIILKSLEAHTYFDRSVSTSRIRGWGTLVADYWVSVAHKFLDEFNPHPSKIIPYVKSLMSQDYTIFLEFIEFTINHPSCPNNLSNAFNNIFERSGFAYRIHDKRIIPIANEVMAESVMTALTALSDPYEGARAHLEQAARSLSQGAFADCVRESVHAVESVARKISPGSNTLGPALQSLTKSHRLHPALQKGFLSLYGYSSDEEGVRHALVDDASAQVTEAEALYMLGSCASFAGYLANLAV